MGKEGDKMLGIGEGTNFRWKETIWENRRQQEKMDAKQKV